MALWAFEAIGTRWEIETEHKLVASARERVSSVIEAFDRTWSRFRSDSLVAQMAGGGAVPLPADAEAMLRAYRAASAATAGAVNPLVGESLARLGYDASYTLHAGSPRPAPSGWERLLSWDDDTLHLHGPATIDVGAVGKGRLVDRVLDALTDHPGGVVVDASGDIAVRDRVVRIGLEHPYDPATAIGVATIRAGALCASATNRRAWGDGLHHVIDARTGQPVRRWAATWAMADDAMTADAVSTALFFDGGEELARQWGVEWVRMATDGRVQRSASAPAELFVAANSRPNRPAHPESGGD